MASGWRVLMLAGRSRVGTEDWVFIDVDVNVDTDRSPSYSIHEWFWGYLSLGL
jgi:hypothetical protein